MATRKVRTGSTRRRLARGQAGKMLGGAALLGAAWLLCGPVLQRSRQLELVLERPDEAGEAMFSLCRTEGGARAASRLEGRPLSDARGVLLAEALAERPRALLIEIEEPEPGLEVPEPEPERAPGPGELRMPRLGESLRVGGGGVLFMAPAGGE
jgi:hypothetical protein